MALEEIPAKIKLSPVLLRKIDGVRPQTYIKSYYTGYMLSVDTFYVCRLKGVGRIYHFTAIDTYSSFGFAYLYTVFKEHIKAIEPEVLNLVIFYIKLMIFYPFHLKILILNFMLGGS